jgi:hypothetical protein
VVKALNETNIPWQYESEKISYTVPESKHTYNPDFVLSNGVYLEGKGILIDHQERTKYILLKQQHPNLDLRFIFGNPEKKCGGMKLTHGDWAIKNGFQYCSVKDVETIKLWINETK